MALVTPVLEPDVSIVIPLSIEPAPFKSWAWTQERARNQRDTVTVFLAERFGQFSTFTFPLAVLLVRCAPVRREQDWIRRWGMTNVRAAIAEWLEVDEKKVAWSYSQEKGEGEFVRIHFCKR
jgi:hypothetical protein